MNRFLLVHFYGINKKRTFKNLLMYMYFKAKVATGSINML